MRKPTFKDITAQAGVGTVTVDRVLNNRGGVSPDAVGLLRIEVLLVQPQSTFT
ncbi:LacI family DNA-binding transcriptional regulator [Paracoccus haematequi]|uniref:LacI family DNA-binding transcriptional regulator n=1 Tax=Paracoccus haematequi TaxID=2491866 RepID=UPI000F7E8338|nr:LacI family DNA-binding transcriptional regulator [Paracoccus haematequi]